MTTQKIPETDSIEELARFQSPERLEEIFDQALVVSSVDDLVLEP